MRVPRQLVICCMAAALLTTAACGDAGDDEPDATSDGRWNSSEVLVIGAIPDQEPQELQRLFDEVAGYLSSELGVDVSYLPVTDYNASVSLFRLGDLDLVWYGGLTGVQARLQLEGAEAIVQRDIDEDFHSVFIANASTGLEPFDEVAGLQDLADTRFTFGSESSTSGRLMPEYFLTEAGVSPDDFNGEIGYSGDHDKTIDLVAAGTYETGALNEQVWDARLDDGSVDTDAVIELFRTPAYHDYHWVIRPDVDETYGQGFTQAVGDAFLALESSNPDDAAILDLFGAGSFIETDNGNYGQIEEVGRSTGLIE